MSTQIDNLLAGMTRAESTGLTDEEQDKLVEIDGLIDEIIVSINARKNKLDIYDALQALGILIGTSIRDYAPNELEKISTAIQLAAKIIDVAMEPPKTRGPKK